MNLARLLTQCSGRVRTIVFFVIPSGMPSHLATEELWANAAAIPGVEVRLDPGRTTSATTGRTNIRALFFIWFGWSLAVFGGNHTRARS